MICKVCDRPVKQVQNRNRSRCQSCNTKIRRYRQKQRAIELLGSKCSSCGWSGHQAAMEFHHTRDKSFAFGSMANIKWERLLTELAKCVLLCSNCHRIHHSTKDDPKLIEAARTYFGRRLQ